MKRLKYLEEASLLYIRSFDQSAFYSQKICLHIDSYREYSRQDCTS
jgi:hypothetical protein